jgi:hypothetical protein
LVAFRLDMARYLAPEPRQQIRQRPVGP